MAFISRTVATRLGWTLGSFGVMQGLRFGNNVILARLLAPELFGIMLIVNTVRIGIELLSDIGIGQNLVKSPSGEDPEFYSTAWTMQILRGVLLGLVCLAAAVPLAMIYDQDILLSIVPVIAVQLVVAGLQSPANYLIQRRMELKKKATFDVLVTLAGSVVYITFALISPTIWAFVLGGLISQAITAIGTFMLVPGLQLRLMIARKHALEILHFGKWIFLATMVYFLASNVDRLILAGQVSMAMLGIYGVARSFTEVIWVMVVRVGSYVVFPMIAASSDDRPVLRAKIGKAGFLLLLGGAVLVAGFIALSEGLIHLLYDQRYWDAGAMLPVLALGVWFSILAAIGDAVLMGVGKPAYNAIGNLVKLAWLLVALPLGFSQYGFAAAIIVIAVSDIFRYAVLAYGLWREELSFLWRELALTIMLIALAAGLHALLWKAGLVPDAGGPLNPLGIVQGWLAR